jgi:hypothetical protein
MLLLLLSQHGANRSTHHSLSSCSVFCLFFFFFFFFFFCLFFFFFFFSRHLFLLSSAMSSPTTTPTPQASRNSSTIQFGNFVTEHELLSRTIPSLFSSVRPPTVLTSAATPTPTWHHIPPPQPNRGAPRLSLGSVQVSDQTQKKKKKKNFFFFVFASSLKCSIQTMLILFLQVSRNEWSAGDTVTSLRGWHTPFAAPAFVYSFGTRRRVSTTEI